MCLSLNLKNFFLTIVVTKKKVKTCDLKFLVVCFNVIVCLEIQIMLIAAFFKCLIVGEFCYVEFVFATSYSGQPFRDHGWWLVLNVGLVVGLDKNLLQSGVRFSKEPVFSAACIKGDVEKIGLMHFGIIGTSKLVALEQFSDPFFYLSVSGPEVLGSIARPSSL